MRCACTIKPGLNEAFAHLFLQIFRAKEKAAWRRLKLDAVMQLSTLALTFGGRPSSQIIRTTALNWPKAEYTLPRRIRQSTTGPKRPTSARAQSAACCRLRPLTTASPTPTAERSALHVARLFFLEPVAPRHTGRRSFPSIRPSRTSAEAVEINPRPWVGNHTDGQKIDSV